MPAALSSARNEAGPEQAGLRHTDADAPGWSRKVHGRGFRYTGCDGNALGPRQLKRAKELALPPAWQDVWINPDARGHIQATGVDEAGRKQYRYHPDYRALREYAKFEDLVQFGDALPGLRAAVARRLALRERDELDEDERMELALATIVRMLDRGALRIGAHGRDTLGAVSLGKRNVSVDGDDELEVKFRGKGGKKRRVELDDRLLAEAVCRLQALPGQRLFDLGDRRVTSTHVNDFLKEVSGLSVTAKDFRTWAGSACACACLMDAREDCTVKQMSEAAAERLGNTPAIARSSYIHPALIDLAKNWQALPPPKGHERLRVAERQLMGIIS